MTKDWIHRENVRAFCEVLSHLAKCDFDDWDWDAMSAGIVGTNDETGCWYRHDFTGKPALTVEFAVDAESDVVHIRANVPRALEPKIAVLVSVAQDYTLAPRR